MPLTLNPTKSAPITINQRLDLVFILNPKIDAKMDIINPKKIQEISKDVIYTSQSLDF